MTRIINIIGARGSGKSYLLELIKKRLGNAALYIDTDDINDKNALKYLEEKHLTSKNTDDYLKYLDKKNKEDLKELISAALEKNKDIIVTGILINKIATEKYCIRIDLINYYKQLTAQSIEMAAKHAKDIKRLLGKNLPLEHIYEVCVRKYKIKPGCLIPPEHAEELLSKTYKQAKLYNYKILPFDHIFVSVTAG